MLHEVHEKYPTLRTKILAPFVIKINPNYMTVTALIFAILAGLAFWQGNFLLAAAFVLLNGFFDMLDGEIAKKYGASAFGDFLDHTLDRVADSVIFIGIAMYNFTLLSFLTLISVLLVSYVGTQAHALTKARLYAGWLGRADRLILLTITALATFFYPQALFYGLVAILILSTASFFQRFYLLAKMLAKS